MSARFDGTMYSQRLNNYGHRAPASRNRDYRYSTKETTLLERSMKNKPMIERSPAFSGQYRSGYSTPSISNTNSSFDPVRPSIRGSNQTTKNFRYRGKNFEDISYSQINEYPRTTFRTISSTNYKKSFATSIYQNGSKNIQPSISHLNGLNGSSSRSGSFQSTNGILPARNKYSEIEVIRNINTTSTQMTGSYSPHVLQNRSNNNNLEDSKHSRSSAGSRNSDGSHASNNGIASSSRSFPSPNAGLVGLRNIGNTCFMNSILQCLSNTEALRDYCLDQNYVRDINKVSSTMKGKLVEAFSDILEKLWHPSSSTALSPSTFKSQIQKFSSRFSGYEQQDSQEFLRFLIEGLHEDVNKVTGRWKEPMPNFDSYSSEDRKAKETWDWYLSKDKSYIVDLFMGQLKSSLTCAECQHVSTTFDPFWDLSLPLSKNSFERRSIQNCLQHFTKEETLEGDERPVCGKCKARRRMSKKFTIYRFPKILVLHLKRFNEGQRIRQKLSHDVEFPHKLQIDPPISTSPVRYNLYAVSNHSGSCYGGHYTAYCKNPGTNEWHSFNDSLVSSISSTNVQSKEAYVLFYEMSRKSQSRL